MSRAGEKTPWTPVESGNPMDDRRCRATARTGERCKRYAVPGGRVCVMHGGASPQARAAARQRLAEREATALLQLVWDPEAAPVTDPVGALQSLAGKLQHAADVLGARIDTAELDGPTGLAWARVMRELRLALEGMQRLDLAGKHVQLESERAQMVTLAVQAGMVAVAMVPMDRGAFVEAFLAQLRLEDGAAVFMERLARSSEPEVVTAGALVAEVIRGVLDRLELSEQQRALVPVVVPEELRRIPERPVVRGELS